MVSSLEGWSLKPRRRSVFVLPTFLMLSCTQQAQPSTSARTNKSPQQQAKSVAKTGTWPPADATESSSALALKNNPKRSPYCDRPEAPIALLKDMADGADQILDSALGEIHALPPGKLKALAQKVQKLALKSEAFAGKLNRPGTEKARTYLQRLVDDLIEVSDQPKRKLKVMVQRDSSFNAFALPGDLVVVNTGLLQGKEALRNEAELVAILGHEVAHVLLEHPMVALHYALRSTRAAKDILEMEETPDPALVAGLLSLMRQPLLSTAQERAADQEGLALVVERGYNPMAGAKMWMRRTPKPTPQADPLGELLKVTEQVLTESFGSHPPTPGRICTALEVAREASERKPMARFYDGKTNLKRLIPGSQQVF